MVILHGENTVQSRQKLVELITEFKSRGFDVIRLEAAKLTEAELEQHLGSQNLFGSDKVLVIEELHSLPKSHRKENLLTAVATYAQNQSATELVLWEKRPLTATMLKKFGTAQAEEFKISKSLFKWLDSLSGDQQTKTNQIKLFHQTLETDDEFMCWAMLMRQIRLLIQAKDGGTIKGAPFIIAKLKSQAKSFTLEQLLAAHQRLLTIDLEHKTSKTKASLSQDLDLFLFKL